jgi:hypothetical protein
VAPLASGSDVGAEDRGGLLAGCNGFLRRCRLEDRDVAGHDEEEAGEPFARWALRPARNLPWVPEDALDELVDRNSQRAYKPQCRDQAQVVATLSFQPRDGALVEPGRLGELSG